MIENNELKNKVKQFWNGGSCGEIYAVGEKSEKEYYEVQASKKYELEPYIFDFAKFCEGYDKDVLEIGVGMGADHVEWARHKPKSLTGIDLTPRAVEHTKKRLSLFNFNSNIMIADAEKLPFNDNSFDIVYSWGVLHHSPNTQLAINEVYRTLRSKGRAGIMIYHKPSIIGYLLWLRYGLLTGHPFRSLDYLYWHYLESCGTKAYSIKEARKLFKQFSNFNIKVQLSHGDLLMGSVGQKHHSFLLRIAKRIWPRSIIKKYFKNFGGMLLIEARK